MQKLPHAQLSRKDVASEPRNLPLRAELQALRSGLEKAEQGGIERVSVAVEPLLRLLQRADERIAHPPGRPRRNHQGVQRHRKPREDNGFDFQRPSAEPTKLSGILGAAVRDITSRIPEADRRSRVSRVFARALSEPADAA